MPLEEPQVEENKSAEDFAGVRHFIERGLYVQAWEASKAHGHPADWQGCEAQILGGRLIAHLGAPRGAARLHLKAYRSNRNNASAAYFRGARIFGSRGPFRAWKFLNTLPGFPEASAPDRADLLALRARVLAALRDFPRAAPLIDEAVALAPGRPWLWCEKAEILRAWDKNAEALANAEYALHLHPHYRPAVHVAAELLQAANRDADSLALLRAADERLESGAITCQLAVLQMELADHEGALRSWRRARDLHPAAEPEFLTWLSGRLADACYHAGEYAEAAEHARKVGGTFYHGFADRLQDNPEPVRVILPVDFVAQHHMTCAPATLSAVSRYWKAPVDHAGLAAEICYEGTQDHIERHWAERQGFVVKEFRVTWDITRRLIDRGVPFTLATVETNSAHLQSVIGYDLLRETLILREPSHRIHAEMTAEWFFPRYTPFGPRGMVFLPPEEAHRLEGLVLPDEKIYDACHRLARGIETHDRDTAEEQLAWLAATAPGHRLTWWARRRLAAYDGDVAAELEAASQLVELFPECANYLWNKSIVLGRSASGQVELPAFLQKLATGPLKEPVFWRDWGRELARDGRRLREARRYLMLALRVQPGDADNLAEFANSLWNEREFEAAAEIYRFAACHPGGGERFGRSYFLAARHIRKTDEALAFLRARFDESGRASVQPGRVLFHALAHLDRNNEALALLDEALALRPDDGELLLFAADQFARHGFHERAGRVLATARGRAARTAWLRVSAGIAGYRCDHAAALALWREILDAEPLATDALRAVARLLAETEGRDAALRFLEERLDRFPHYLPLLELRIEWSKAGLPEQGEPIIRQALGINPHNAWIKRELACNLADQRRFDEAIAEAREALQMEPFNETSHGILGQVLRQADRPGEAAGAFRAALRLSVDYTWGIHGLFQVSPGFEQKGAAVEFVRQELIRQVVFGDSLFAFREEAFAVLDPEALLSVLRDAHVARQDLWQAWVVLAQQLVDMKKFDEALDVASRAVHIFPLIPRCWYELAMVHKVRGGRDEEIFALEGALVLSPGWGLASRGLADAHTRGGDFPRVRAILEQAVSFSPLDSFNHGYLADVLWHVGEKEKAVTSLEQAVRLNPDYRWGWDTLAEWSMELGRENHGLALARELTVSRAGESRSWMQLASTLGPGDLEEKLAALRRAAEIDPRNPDVHDARASVLAEAGRYDEALAACQPSVFAASMPVNLKGRAAWIHADRGDLLTAVGMMRSTVQESPDYYWGWNCLTEWQTTLGNLPEALTAAQNMERLAPRASVPLGYIGRLQLQMGRLKDAAATFRRAFDLDPAYEYAGRQLFDGQVKEGKLDEAESTLQALQLHHPGPSTDTLQIRLHCARGHRREAIEGLRALCFAPARGAAALRQAAAFVTGANWQAAAEKVFKDLLDHPNVNPEIGGLWVEAFTQRGAWSEQRRMSELHPATPLGRSTRFAFLEAAVRGDKTQAVQGLVEREGEALRADPDCWAQVGYAFFNFRQYSKVITWMRDWRSQPNLQPWMLHNLAMALRNEKCDDEAHKVNLHAVGLRGDHTTVLHQLFLAWDDAMAGRLPSARARLNTVVPGQLEPYFQVVHALGLGLVSVMEAEPDDREQEFEAQKYQLQQESWLNLFSVPLLHRMGGATVKRMANRARQLPFSLGAGQTCASSRDGRGNTNYWPWVFGGFVIVQILARGCSSP